MASHGLSGSFFVDSLDMFRDYAISFANFAIQKRVLFVTELSCYSNGEGGLGIDIFKSVTGIFARGQFAEMVHRRLG